MKHKKNKDKLSPKQKMFCYEYMKDLNGKQAAIRAGYSAKTAEVKGSQLLRLVKVMEFVSQLQNERKKDSEITEEYLLNNLKEVTERCMQRVPVMVFDKVEKKMVQMTEEVEQTDGTFKEEGVWTFLPMAVIKSTELLMRHKGMLIEKVQHSGEVKTIMDLVKHAAKK